jgi:hypothetical protein
MRIATLYNTDMAE